VIVNNLWNSRVYKFHLQEQPQLWSQAPRRRVEDQIQTAGAWCTLAHKHGKDRLKSMTSSISLTPQLIFQNSEQFILI
jgi:hypothetical protein